jgi:hypothetical protein
MKLGRASNQNCILRNLDSSCLNAHFDIYIWLFLNFIVLTLFPQQLSN